MSVRAAPSSRVALALVSLVLASCAQKISRTDLAARIESGSPPVIVDVRSGGEFREGHVPGAVHIPFYAVIGRRSEIPPEGEEPVVVYCEHGPRAGIARASLWLSRVGPIVYLDGHMTAWREEGLPIDASSLEP